MKIRALVVGRVAPVLVAVMVFGLTAGRSEAIVSNFTSVWTSTETDGTNFVSVGDLDGDGDPDMAVCGGGAATAEPVRAYRNDGGNTFSLLWSSTENLNCWEVQMGDSDNDGDLDLLTANDTSTPNRLYANDGTGVFTLVWSDTDNDNTSSVAWGDYDRDGDLDFWAGNQSGLSDRLYRNDGGNNFTAVWLSPDTSNTDALAWGDTDGDGDLDMLVGNTGVARTLYRNDGADTFTSVWSSTEVDSLSDVALGDVDNDGDLDLVTSGYNVNARVYGGDGANGFTLQWSSPTTLFGQNVALGDTNADGLLDIVVGVEGAANELYLNGGAMAFNSDWTSADTDATIGIALADADGDGDMDIFAGNRSQANRVYVNNDNPANTAPSAPTLIPMGGGMSGSIPLMWAGDSMDDHTLGSAITYNLRVGTFSGGNDVMSGIAPAGPGNVGQALSHALVLSAGVSSSQTYYWSVQAVDATGFLTSSFAAEGFFTVSAAPPNAYSLSFTSSEMDNAQAMAVGDLDNDGDNDIAMAVASAPKRVYLNVGGFSFISSWTSIETSATTCVDLGDYDGDGYLDMLFGNGASEADQLYHNDSGAGFSLAWSSTVAANTNGVRLADMNNDGHLDVVSAGDTDLNLYYGDGAGNFSAASQVITGGTLHKGLAVGDINGDGRLDIVLANSGGARQAYLNNGDGSYTLNWTSAETEANEGIKLGDHDGDGDLDLAVTVPAGNNRIYQNDGMGTFASVWLSPNTADYRGVDWADYDGDGALDLVQFGNVGWVVELFRNMGAGNFVQDWASAETGEFYAGAFADFDGDGDADLAAKGNGEPLYVYENTLNPPNTPPSMLSLTAEPDGVSGSVTLAWTAGNDDITPPGQLTYNLRVGTTPGGSEILSSRVPSGPGNVGQAVSHTLNLSDGGATVTYYWSVQSVDNTAYARSAFLTEDSFILGGGGGGDTTGPTGGAIAYTGGVTNALSVSLTLTPATDAQSTMSTSAFILRADALYDGTACGNFTSFASIAEISSASTSHVDAVTAGMCYQYQYKALDTLGNFTIFSSAAVVQVDAGMSGSQPLSAPVNLLVSNVLSDSADLSWDAVVNAVAYDISVVDVQTTLEVVSASVTVPQTSFTATGLSPGVSYSAIVVAIDANSAPGLPPTPVDFITQGTPQQPSGSQPLAAPANLSVSSVLTSSALLSWDAVQNAVAYGLSVVDVQTTIEVISTSVTAPQTTFTASGLTHNTSYSVVLTAIDANNVASAPGAALLFHTTEQNWASVSDITHNSVTVNWQNITTVPVGKELGFLLSPPLSVNPDGLYFVSSAGNTSDLSHNLTGLAPETQYTVLVFAVTDGNSARNQQYLSVSQPVAFTTLAAPQQLPAPANLSVSNILTDSADLSWDAVQDAAAYGISVVDVQTTIEVVSTSVTAPQTSFTATGLTHNTSYSVVLTAIDANNVASAPGATLLFHTTEQNWASVSDITHNSVTVNWQNITTVPVGKELGFLLSPALSVNPDGLYFVSSTGNTSDLSYNLTGLAPETQYTVLVFAVIDGNSARNQQYLSVSQPVAFTTLAAPQQLPAPANLSASHVGPYDAQVSWEAVPGAAAYAVALQNSLGEFVSLQLVTAPLTSITFTDLSPVTSYSVQVAALDANQTPGTPAGPFAFVTSPPPPTIAAGFPEADLGLVTPGTYTVQLAQIITPGGGGTPMNVRLLPQPIRLVTSGESDMSPRARMATSEFLVVTDPPVIPSLGAADNMLIKVRVPMGTTPGRYQGQQFLLADTNNNFLADTGDAATTFNLSFTVSDFAAQGATCPLHEAIDIGDQVPPPLPAPARVSLGSINGTAMQVFWAAVPNAVSYIVRLYEPGSADSLVFPAQGTDTWVCGKLNVFHTLTVEAVDKYGQSGQPSAPQGTSAGLAIGPGCTARVGEANPGSDPPPETASGQVSEGVQP